ncbi:hypothetical protein SNEBB_002547 [Seison nebaliae]|nr:hypothetical protein SNEBB_002547 [Seison nebaliae]
MSHLKKDELYDDNQPSTLDDRLEDPDETTSLRNSVKRENVRFHEEVDVVEVPRETWSGKLDFLLSIIGFAVDLANIWRFPYLCYKNGGGVFLIPYCIVLFMGGIPLFYMELALGQYNKLGAIACWRKICPLFKGVGYAVVLIAFYVDFYYNVILSWALYYFFASFSRHLPWSSCDNWWNTEECFDIAQHLRDKNGTRYTNLTEMTIHTNYSNGNSSSPIAGRRSPAEEYFHRFLFRIDEAHGLHDMGPIKWQNALSLLAVYLICYFSMWKGVKSSGKVVWFTALFPYIVLCILIINGATLEGAKDGIVFYLSPKWERLREAQVWVDAASQVFFSLGPGFGVLLAFASYNDFHNNIYKDALITSLINFFTSFLSGFAIFMILGYMARVSGKPINKVAEEGTGLVFFVYPEAISTMWGSTFWSIMFFLMLLTLGLDSSFGGSEAIITAISDEFPILAKHRELFVGGLFSFYMLVGLPSCTYGGIYLVELFNQYSVVYSILFAVLFEALTISWIYGIDQFKEDINEMLGFKPGIYWTITWKFAALPCLVFVIGFGLYGYKPLQYKGYTYPLWANIVGGCIAVSSVICIPIMALHSIITAKGDTLKEKFLDTLKPRRKLRVKPDNKKQLKDVDRTRDDMDKHDLDNSFV